jgi:subtilisin family serine protease
MPRRIGRRGRAIGRCRGRPGVRIRVRWRSGTVVAVVVLAVACVGSGAGASGIGPTAFGGQSPHLLEADSSAATFGQFGETTVTLITGDRVLVGHAPGGGYAVEAHPGPGREGMLFAIRRVGHRALVVPLDAGPFIVAGVLDERLFDVATLVGFGFDDKSSHELPLLLEYGASGSASSVQSVLVPGARVVRDLPVVHALAVGQNKKYAPRFWRTWSEGAPARARIKRIWLDGGIRPMLDRSVPQVGAPTAWRAGLTGRGVKVAVLDTGYDAGHPDLTGRVVAAQNFTTDTDLTDSVGHGTHVASIIAGSGAASGGRYRGVAPGASLLVGKVCEVEGCQLSSIIAGMAWASAEGATVVNMSLGGEPSDGSDPLSQAVDELTAETGTLFVVSAGNFGLAGAQTVTEPAAADSALAVGSVTKSDTLSTFSSRGPRLGDNALKPEITAPGERIVAARAHDTFDQAAVSEAYAELSGTSMAAPHVAGAAAILAQEHPNWRADRLAAALTRSAQPLDGLGVYEQGAGRLDIARAIALPISTSPASLSLGVAAWPHDDDRPIVKTITYRNDGDRPVTLQADLEITDPDGRRAPPQMFEVSKSSISIPANSETTVNVSADTSVHGADGAYGGWLTARSRDGIVVRTAVGVDKEVPSYQLTISMRDRQGQLVSTSGCRIPGGTCAFIYLLNVETEQAYTPFVDNGAASVRLPQGTYIVDALLGKRGQSGEADGYREGVLFPEPTLVVTRDSELVLDGRRAVRVETVAPVEGASATTGGVGFARPVNNDVFIGGVGVGNAIVRDTLPTLYVVPNSTGSKLDFTAFAHLAWAKMPASPSPFSHFFLNSPYLYHDVAAWPGRIPDHPRLATRAQDYARIDATYASGVPRRYGNKFGYPYLPLPGHPGETFGPWIFTPTVEMSLPFERSEYYAVGGGIDWAFGFEQYNYVEDGGGEIELEAFVDGPITNYEAGRRYTEQWNSPVFGPSLPRRQLGAPVNHTDTPWAFRDGDTLSLALPMFADAGTGRAGIARHESEETALYRDEQLLWRTNAPYLQTFRVPPERGAYRLTKLVTRSADVYGLSTRIESSWTFHSERVEDGTQQALPLMVVRYAPALDDRDRAPGGGDFSLPLVVEWQYGAPAANVRRLTLDVSFDDGQTWQPASVKRTGTGWTARLTHPAHGFVSLRTSAVDTAGDSVEQVIIRAYELR